MSQEHHHEAAERNEQAKAELESAGREQLDRLRHEPTPENDSHRRVEAAREAINKQEPKPEATPAPETQTAPVSRHPLLHHKLNYTDTMRSLQKHLSPTSRAFSRAIHTPIVEKTSEVLEKTVARPSVTLGATWTALIVGGLFYLTARHYGYMLSGSELLFSFIVGALIGLAIEGLWRSLKRR